MNRYAKSLLYAGLVSCALGLAAAPSFAQVNSTSNATSVSGSASGASSRAAANSGASTNQQNINFNSPGDTRSTNTNNNNVTSRSQEGVNYSGGTSNTTHVTGDQTIRTAPTVYAPPVSGGNPCSLGVSAGASFLGWGAAAGGSYVDQDCANRQKIAMIHNAGYAGAAKELMCNDRDAYFAFRTAGQPCAFRAAFEGGAPAQPVAPPVVVAPQPTPITPTIAPRTTQVAPKQYVRCNPRAGIVDNCVSG